MADEGGSVPIPVVPDIRTCPLVSIVQRIGVYETKARLFVIGSNNTQQRFHVLKIDRTEPRALSLLDDGVEYSHAEIRAIMRNLDEGNRSRSSGMAGPGLVRKLSAFGIVGFVRFTEGYYLVVITQRRRVALIGQHVIYKIEDTKMLYIPNCSGSANGDGRKRSAIEQRYARIFQGIGMGSNFYFSYSYDLTRTLQDNMTPPRLTSEQLAVAMATANNVTKQQQQQSDTLNRPSSSEEVGSQDRGLSSSVGGLDRPSTPGEISTQDCGRSSSSGVGGTPDPDPSSSYSVLIGTRTAPHHRFMWNSHLLAPVTFTRRGTCGESGTGGGGGGSDGEGVGGVWAMCDQLSWPWRLAVTHGYLGQALLYVNGRGLLLTLIARRSSLFAGTRFLKRGANYSGDVANEVETEQIVSDATVSSLEHGLHSSHVQVRGSVPGHWYQDPGRIPKPPIQMDMYDPCYLTAGRHFSDLLNRYGSPVHVVNLVKRSEGRSCENLLHTELRSSISYLNRFLPRCHRLRYISLDMARINKLKRVSVMARLTEIADETLQRTGYFLSRPPSECSLKYLEQCLVVERDGMRQSGVVRTNCVDCLDRTNTAQFAIGKSALALQLCSMGVLSSPSLAFDTDCLAILEELFEDHGDVLALQYGGSQLVHRIRTYRKTARWGSHGSDIVQTVQRYYSNTFSDSDKQNAINLFLGVYSPTCCRYPLWELPSDHLLHMHHKDRDINKYSRTQWWSDELILQLPRALNEIIKSCVAIVPVSVKIRTDQRHLPKAADTAADDLRRSQHADGDPSVNAIVSERLPSEELSESKNTLESIDQSVESRDNPDHDTKTPNRSPRYSTKVADLDGMANVIDVRSGGRLDCRLVNDCVDLFSESYRPSELTSLSELFIVNIAHSARDYMPATCVNNSPFVVRSQTGNVSIHNARPGSLSGSSADSDFSESEGASSGEDASSSTAVSVGITRKRPSIPAPPSQATFTAQSARSVYGIQIISPGHQDLDVYRRYAQMGRRGGVPRSSMLEALSACERPLPITQHSQFKLDTSRQVTALFTVSASAAKIYQMSVESCRVKTGLSVAEYRKYLSVTSPTA